MDGHKLSNLFFFLVTISLTSIFANLFKKLNSLLKRTDTIFNNLMLVSFIFFFFLCDETRDQAIITCMIVVLHKRPFSHGSFCLPLVLHLFVLIPSLIDKTLTWFEDQNQLIKLAEMEAKQREDFPFLHGKPEDGFDEASKIIVNFLVVCFVIDSYNSSSACEKEYLNHVLEKKENSESTFWDILFEGYNLKGNKNSYLNKSISYIKENYSENFLTNVIQKFRDFSLQREEDNFGFMELLSKSYEHFYKVSSHFYTRYPHFEEQFLSDLQPEVKITNCSKYAKNSKLLRDFFLRNEDKVLDISLLNKYLSFEEILSQAYGTSIRFNKLDKYILKDEYGNSPNFSINKFISEFFSSNNVCRFMASDTVVSRGYYKMHSLIKSGLSLKGRILDLTTGSGGMSQRMCQEPLVIEIFGNNLRDSTNQRKSTVDFKTTGYHKRKMLNHKSGDFTARSFLKVLEPLNKFDAIIMDCAEWKTDYPSYCAWFLPRLLSLKPLLSRLSPGGKLIFKQYCMDEFNWQATKTLIQQFSQVNNFVIPTARNTNGETYLVCEGYTPGAKHNHKLHQIWTPVLDTLNAKIVNLNSDIYMFKGYQVIKRPRLELLYRSVCQQTSSILQPLDFTNAINFLKINYGAKESNLEQVYKRFKTILELGRPMDLTHGNSIIRAMAHLINKIVNLGNYFNIDRWTTTQVTPYHTLTTTFTKYDSVPNIDNFPVEEYISCAQFVKNKVLNKIKFRPKTFEETKQKILTGQAAHSSPGFISNKLGSDNAEVLTHPDFEKAVKDCIKEIEMGRYPKEAIINVMGKFERKKINSTKGVSGRINLRKPDSRLIFFGDIVFRFIEEMYFGDLFTHLTNPFFNKFAIGHGSYCDYGDLIESRYQNKGFGVAKDIAGWDTRYHKYIREMEYDLVKSAMDDEYLNFVTNMWKILSNALLMLTRPTTDCMNMLETDINGRYVVPTDLKGLPKSYKTEICLSDNIKMSGERGTYDLNTYNNVVLHILHFSKTFSVDFSTAWDEMEGVVSGDDSVFFYNNDRLDILNSVKFWKDTAFLRKDVAEDEPDRKITNINNMEFCSSTYEKIHVTLTNEDGTFRRITKRLPTRSYEEIFGKFQYSLVSCSNILEQISYDKGAAISALILYIGMRHARSYFRSILASIPTNIRAQYTRDWFGFKTIVDEHDMLKTIKNALFPLEPGTLKSWDHIGYIALKNEKKHGFINIPGNETVRFHDEVRSIIKPTRDLFDTISKTDLNYDDMGLDIVDNSFMIKRDIFSPENTLPIVHCISEDKKMSKGFAKIVSQFYGKPKEEGKVGSALIDKNASKVIFSLITKKKFSDKPTLDSLKNTLISLREICFKFKIFTLSMPMIGCGLDRLKPEDVMKLIKEELNSFGIVTCIFDKPVDFKIDFGRSFPKTQDFIDYYNKPKVVYPRIEMINEGVGSQISKYVIGNINEFHPTNEIFKNVAMVNKVHYISSSNRPFMEGYTTVMHIDESSSKKVDRKLVLHRENNKVVILYENINDIIYDSDMCQYTIKATFDTLSNNQVFTSMKKEVMLVVYN